MSHNSQLTYEEYIKVHKATEKVLAHRKNSHAYHDYMRAKGAAKAYRDWNNKKITNNYDKKKPTYIAKAIMPKVSTQFTKKVYNNLYRVYGDAIIKVRLVDRNFFEYLSSGNRNKKIISLGGACVLESSDMRIISYLNNQGMRDHVKLYTEEIFKRVPTWTQIIGSIIPASGLSAMYDETFPWHLRIAEYGLADPELSTQRKYDYIFSGVQRYAKLINPLNTIVKIPFSQLNLDSNNYLKEWLKQMMPYLDDIKKKYELPEVDFNPDKFYKAWIEYTYVGPEILKIIKKIIKKNHPNIYENYLLKNKIMHVRGKQVDHLDTERHNLWMHRYLLDQPKEFDSYEKLLKSTNGRLGLSIYLWIRDNLKLNKTVGLAGFLDMNCKGHLTHEETGVPWGERKKLAKQKKWKELCDSPLKLHAGNVSQVTDFLHRFSSPSFVSFSQNSINMFTKSKIKIQKLRKKIQKLDNYINSFKCFLKVLENRERNKIFTSKSTKDNLEFITTRKLMINRFPDVIEIDNKVVTNKLKSIIRSLFDAIFYDQEKDFNFGKNTREYFFDKNLLKKLIELSKKYQANDENVRINVLKNLKKEEILMKPLYSDLFLNISKQQSDNLTQYVKILPLVDNIFFSYMQQLLFIPSIREAYLDMVSIEENKHLRFEKKEELITITIKHVFNIVESSIRYIMGEGAYPWKERYEIKYERAY